MSDPLPRYLYTTLYYVTHQSDQKAALEEFVDVLLDSGYDLDFIQTMQFDLFPISVVTNQIAVSAQFWK